MSQNVGSFFSILLTPWIKDHPTWVIVLGPLRFDSWHLAFGLSSIGLTLGLLNYGAFHRYMRPYGTAPDFKKLDVRKLLAVVAISLAVAYLLSDVIRYHLAAIGVGCLFVLLIIYVFARLLRTGTRHERSRVIACIIFIVMSSIWAIYNQQIYTSLTLFALRNVEHHILSIPVSAGQFQDLNQFWLVLLALPLAWFYQRMGRTKRGDFSIASKYATGLYLLAIAFFLYAASSLTARAGIVSSWWLVAGFAAQSLGELLISALGFSMVARLVPEHSRGIIMGAWFLGVGISLYAGGAIAGLASIPRGTVRATATLPIYTHLFWGLGAGALACAIVATAITPLLARMMLERDEEPLQALIPIP
jgi:POT family proton-dependent oligopeptide transporter